MAMCGGTRACCRLQSNRSEPRACRGAHVACRLGNCQKALGSPALLIPRTLAAALQTFSLLPAQPGCSEPLQPVLTLSCYNAHAYLLLLRKLPRSDPSCLQNTAREKEKTQVTGTLLFRNPVKMFIFLLLLMILFFTET